MVKLPIFKGCVVHHFGSQSFLISFRFWDMGNVSELRKIKKMDNEIESEDQLLCCRFSPDMSQLAVCSNNGNLYLIDMRGIVHKIVENFT